MRPYQTYTGDPDSQIRDACGEAFVSFLADAVTVACDYTEAVAHTITSMQTRWRALNLRRHSSALATLEAMSTMPAVSINYLCEATGRNARTVRRGLHRLVSAGAVTETRDEDSGRRVFEVPELLQVVDHRQSLLGRCWEAHRAGARQTPAELVAVWRHDVSMASAGQQPLKQPRRCSHIGERSRVRCTQSVGHAPPHRYR